MANREIDEARLMAKHGRSLESTRRYYSEVLKSSADLLTPTCCAAEAPEPRIALALANVHGEVRDRFYGCGSPIPLALEGARILDLGCGAGRDCYVLSQLVGANGSVIGVDMTKAQLAVAQRHLKYHAEKFGYANVEFRQGYIEDLRSLDIADASIDVVISNCVINLSPDKSSVFWEIFRVLKPGGELYFSDIFADRRVPEHLADDPVLRGECLGGALYWEDFRRLAAATGCADVRTTAKRPIEIDHPQIRSMLGQIGYRSATVRAFRLELDDRCEDFGQAAIYKGSIPEAPLAFVLDDHHLFETGKVVPVCGNTADMLLHTRYASHFQVIGGRSNHFGLFDCASDTQQPAKDGVSSSSCC